MSELKDKEGSNSSGEIVSEIPSTSEDARIQQRRNPYSMTEDILRKRIQRENKGRYITQLCATVAASLGSLSFGTTLGWSSPSSHQNKTQNIYNLTSDNLAWVSGLMPLGCSLGIMPWSYFHNKFGPKHILIMHAPLIALTFGLMMAVNNFNMYVAGRFFTGFLSISNLIGGKSLMLECVHRGNLPHMLVLFRSSMLLGVLCSYITGLLSWDYSLTLLCMSIPIVNAIFLLFLPESPVFLYEKGELKAENAMGWYKGRSNIYTEMRSLRKDAEIRKISHETYKYMFLSKVVYKAFFIILWLYFFQVFCGYYAFIFYAVTFWQKTPHPFGFALSFGLCLFLSNFIGNTIHYRQRFGVRKPLLLSTTLTAFILTLLAVFYFLLKIKLFSFVNALGWLPMTLMCCFVITYEMGLGTYADILTYEYLPYQVHVQAKTITRICFWFFVFVLCKGYSFMKTHLSQYLIFGILALFTYMGAIFCYLYVVETKGKNLIQIQIEIGGNPIGNRSAYTNRIGGSNKLVLVG